MAIAEVMGYPVHLVEIPRHNFVRWTLGPQEWVDFETMDGVATNDAYYEHSWAIPTQYVGKGGILQTMTRRQAFAYHDATIAIALSWRGNIRRLTEVYRRSISTDATHPLALNNLAWFYAAVPKLEYRDGTKAVRYGSRAVALLADGDNLDTLACAYAQDGNFRSAIATETRAIDANYSPFDSDFQKDLDAFKSTPPIACSDDTFGKDPAPFRPGQRRAQPLTDRELRTLH
jgi:hypothetical protein